MEYYAKSKKVQFTSERINEIKKNMKNIEECLKENLTETDVEILNSSITDIAEKTEEKQKTLKEHHKDIVTCAEMFFLEYGEYFTEKEKKLVVEACRIHDLGKVNLVFQAMICPKLAEKFHIDVRKTSQIPHTEMCTADSLLQRMGRCNRKGRYCPNEANIVVFDNRNGVSEGKRRSVYEDKLYDRSLELLSKYEHILFSEDKKTAYMNEVYSVDGVKETIYFENIQKDLKLFSEIHPTEYSADEAEVRDIRSVTIVPENVYVENQNLFEYGVEFLKKPNMSREARSLIKSKLENLTLSLNLYQKFPAEVDRTTIGVSENRKITDIHRAQYNYEFDIESGKGRGILFDEQLELDGIFV